MNRKKHSLYKLINITEFLILGQLTCEESLPIAIEENVKRNYLAEGVKRIPIEVKILRIEKVQTAEFEIVHTLDNTQINLTQMTQKLSASFVPSVK